MSEEKEKLGRCIIDSQKAISFEIEYGECTYVEGKVWNPNGYWMMHAWLEWDDVVYDRASDQELPVGIYYYVGKIQETYRFTREEVMKSIWKTGAWERMHAWPEDLP